jgi:hypothetical protein
MRFAPKPVAHVDVATHRSLTPALANKKMRPYIIYQTFLLVPQNAVQIELCLRLTNGKPALAHWIGELETKFG